MRKGSIRTGMYHCKISLDMIWMDRQRRIVEIAEQVPPCPPGPPEQCPNYGGHEPAMFVLEAGGGPGGAAWA